MSAADLSANEAESDYFKINPPPRALQEHSDLTQSFVNYHTRANRRVALVTSGGTTVPLETQTVRFIDNFSAGTRGATSAEYFLQEGYAVIFLHRQFSLLPYSRHFSHSTNCFLDFMDETPTVPLSDNHDRNNPEHSSIVVRTEYQNEMRDVLRKYRYAKENNLLLILPYISVTEYLYELRMIATMMKPLGPNALFYLAAAVSDFFIPRDRMVEHKIQSSNEKPVQDDPRSAAHVRDIPPDKIYTGFNDPQPPTSGKKLVIDLDPVPKFLHRLVDGWAPYGSMIVSFKLETDPSLLISKSEQALQRYSHHLVIGNLLSTRKWEVVFVTKGKDGKAQERWIRAPKAKNARRPSITQIHPKAGAKKDAGATGDAAVTLEEMEIESLIVPNVAEMHTGMIKDWSTSNK